MIEDLRIGFYGKYSFDIIAAEIQKQFGCPIVFLSSAKVKGEKYFRTQEQYWISDTCAQPSKLKRGEKTYLTLNSKEKHNF